MANVTDRQPRVDDISAVIGMLAVLEAEMRHPDGPPDWALRVGDRLVRVGLLGQGATPDELWRAVGDLNQRMRYVLGEHDEEDRTS